MADSDEQLVRLARAWVDQDPDPETRAEAEDLMRRTEAGDAAARDELADAFGGRLAFGTAGLRGRLGPGPRRMNRVVVAQTSAGFAAFLRERAAAGETSERPSAVIGYDGRVNSDVFARDAAEILAGAGVAVTLLPEPLPTPVTAFAVRRLGVSAGVMITASHNPPRDNGYKVYLGDADDGAQIVPPIDGEIAARIASAADRPVAELPRSSDYAVAGDDVLEAYVDATATALLAGAAAPASGAAAPRAASPELRVVYTAMHGVGSAPARRLFAAAGLPGVVAVPEQDRPDGGFPTVAFPNPEEPGALDLAFRTAREIGADLVVANDPDADRLAVAAPHPGSPEGYRALTGNQLGLLLGWRAAERHARMRGGSPGALACTIVSSPALRAVARAYRLDYAETLSGFKWVARVPNLVFGFEEALGYLTHPEVVHDKDGISAAADAIALTRELAAEGRTVWDRLDEASERFGHFASAQITVRLDSMADSEALSQRLRRTPPEEFGGVAVSAAADLLDPGLAAVPANVLRYDLADGCRVMIRPSGTEAKLKVYLDAFSDSGGAAERRRATEEALQRIERSAREFLDASLTWAGAR
ncbi:phospho-sugar mutase [Leucobacter sp. CSA1]|uniref:Phospho-sugar mutase n=1 Tax=Leucobacter chromiisoli TaxID=2796471 RepID=A0A934Q8D1_9MICO|nr:phospho-sugar mutase [Leucobacter chromiisoli]MBK0420119.1 phospho-sugar mutase [Leucobacter chromiisoli]